MTFYVCPFSQDLDGNGEISFEEVRRFPPTSRAFQTLRAVYQFKPLWNLIMV